MEPFDYAVIFVTTSAGLLTLAAAGLCTVSFIEEATKWWKYRR